MKNVIIINFLLFTTLIFSQISKKELVAIRINEAPKIDGILDEPVWEKGTIGSDFVMYDPGDGDKEPDDQKTNVKILYDDKGIYIAGYMFDNAPDKILKQLSDRDNFGTSDVFGININPNNDGQNEFSFLVTAAGVQLDAQISPLNGEDYNWNEVWFSKVSHDDKGWYAEIMLPYSALRFSKEEVYTWGVNFHRYIGRKNELYSWNYIDKTVGRTPQYSGVLNGIKDIKPPARLSFAPFASFILDNYDGESNTDYAFGLDLKYGITDNFTLIATLIPDFSQVGFDNVTLNLGPFEQVFAEQRQFFVEGADLLEKGYLFFSRRIGNRPVGNDEVEELVEENEALEIIDNPTEVDVLNAIKVTGRTKKGLGIAVLNAVTKKTEATVKDTITGEKFNIVTEPLANYNVLVIDQEFNKNSSIGITNTNVTREGSFRDANVTALVFSLANKANSYRLSGNGSTSTIRETQVNTTGFASNLRFGKTEGKVRYSLSHRFADDKYDKNDLGYQRSNNYHKVFGNINYRIFKPTKHFNSMQMGVFAGYFRRYDPSVYTGNYFNFFASATTKKQLSFGFEIGTNIGKRRDYFEPRTEGRFWLKNPETEVEGYFSTDSRKKFAGVVSARKGKFHGNNESDFSVMIAPQYRVNDRLQFSYTYGLEKDFNEYGYVTTLEDETIIFGQRYVQEIENAFASKYGFNDTSSIILTFRYYWSPVMYKDQYFELQEDGNLTESEYTGDNDLNFNSWNLDLRYIWQFSRGSELVALYRNSIINSDEESDQSYQDNMSNLFDQPLGQSFSIKFVYYLDYNRGRSWFQKG